MFRGQNREERKRLAEIFDSAFRRLTKRANDIHDSSEDTEVEGDARYGGIRAAQHEMDTLRTELRNTDPPPDEEIPDISSEDDSETGI